jgi:hypothetical protein
MFEDEFVKRRLLEVQDVSLASYIYKMVANSLHSTVCSYRIEVLIHVESHKLGNGKWHHNQTRRP